MSFKNEGNTPLLASLSFKLVLNTASHPFEYAKILIQIGYEPLPPYPTKTLLGKPALGLPNVLQYVKYIKDVDGFVGCYRGLLPRLISNAVNYTTYRTVTDATYKYSLPSVKYPLKKAKGVEEEEDRWEKFIHETLIDICGKITAVVASQPFYVISVRSMAQFVGGETKYDGLFSSLVEIYTEEGFLGFFKGLIPGLCGEILFALFISTCAFMAAKYLDEKDDLRKITGLPISIAGTTFTYPFHVVSSCMAVNDSGLVAGQPPLMPHYDNWIECWNQLSKTRQLSRGSAMFFRYYHGPYATTAAHTYLLTK